MYISVLHPGPIAGSRRVVHSQATLIFFLRPTFLLETTTMTLNRRRFVSLAALPALGGLPFAAVAQAASSSSGLSDYPGKPVKIIVPFPAGGTSDVMGRMIGEELGKIL